MTFTGSNTDNILIGSRTYLNSPTSPTFNGSIADVRIYDRALTQDEITTLYNGLKRVNFTARETYSQDNINNFSITSLYGNKNTTTGSTTLDVPYGNISYNWYNTLGYYNQSNTVEIQTQEEIQVLANNTNTTFLFNEHVYNNILPQLRLTNILYPSLSLTKAITGNNITTQFNAGNFKAEILADGIVLTEQTETITEGTSTINLSDTAMNYVYFNDARTNESLNGSNINVKYPSGTELDLITDENGRINFTTYQDETIEYGLYNITYQDDQGFISPNTFSYNATTLPFNETYNISRANLTINIKDALSRELLTENVTVTIEDIGTFSINGTKTLINQSFVSQEYTVFVNSENYTYTENSFTYTNQESLTVNLFVYNKNTANIGTITVRVYDAFLDVVSEADVRMQELEAETSTFTEVSQGTTDSNGEVNFQVLLEGKTYRFLATKEIRGVTYQEYSTESGAIIFEDGAVISMYLDTISDIEYSEYRGLNINVSNTTLQNYTSYHQVNFIDDNGISHEVCLGYYYIDGYEEKTLLEICEEASSGTINYDGGYTLDGNYTNIVKVFINESGTERVYYEQRYTSVDSFENTFTDLIKPLIALSLIGALAIALHLKRIDYFLYLSIGLSLIWSILTPSYFSGGILVINIVIAVVTYNLAKGRSEAENV